MAFSAVDGKADAAIPAFADPCHMTAENAVAAAPIVAAVRRIDLLNIGWPTGLGFQVAESASEASPFGEISHD